MGVSKCIQIGPYLSVGGKIEVEKVKIKRICPNHQDKETNDKFCPKCGSEIENVEIIDKRKLTPIQFMYDSIRGDQNLFAEGDIWSPEGFDNLFIPNQYPPNKIKIDDSGDFVDLSNSIDLMKEQIDWFSEKFSKEIKVFQDNFGKDNVKVMWGISSYWS